MNEEVQNKIESAKKSFNEWQVRHQCSSARLVQYCGVEHVGTIAVAIDDVPNQLEGLIGEGFYVDWMNQGDEIVMRAWEYGGPEPDWGKVFLGQDLEEIVWPDNL